MRFVQQATTSLHSDRGSALVNGTSECRGAVHLIYTAHHNCLAGKGPVSAQPQALSVHFR